MKEPKAFLNEMVREIGSLAFVGKSLFQLVCYLAYFSQPILIQADWSGNDALQPDDC